jgi:hypothetical protein
MKTFGLSGSTAQIICTALFAVSATAVMSPSAKASAIIDIVQQGLDVVATGSGSLDTTDLTLRSSGGKMLPPFGAHRLMLCSVRHQSPT